VPSSSLVRGSARASVAGHLSAGVVKNRLDCSNRITEVIVFVGSGMLGDGRAADADSKSRPARA
jgi:hypothetical protein